MIVLVANGKHDTEVFATAVAMLRTRLAEDIWYAEDDANRARRILGATATDPALQEASAMRFLRARQGYEYEGFETYEVKQ